MKILVTAPFLIRWWSIRGWNSPAYLFIFVAITVVSFPALTSGDLHNFNNDFYQYLARHEAVRKSLAEHHQYPLRSHWFGGGFPTIGDPEDPTLNPLILLTLTFGAVYGLKVIVFLALQVGGLGMYALTRNVFGYTRWGALFSGLAFGLSLFLPLRILDGNPNEAYAMFLPLCLILVTCRRQTILLLIFPLVLYTMLSDGKHNALMVIFFLGLVCLLHWIPIFNIFESVEAGRGWRPLATLVGVVILTFLLGAVRYLPALALIQSKGGLMNLDLYYGTQAYLPSGIFACQWEQLWQEMIAWKGRVGLVTVGALPVFLFSLSVICFWRRAIPWLLLLLIFSWLILAHHAPFDLLKLLWNLPVFSSLYRPYKYFSYHLAFVVAAGSGQFFWLLTRLKWRWLENLLSLVLISLLLLFLIPQNYQIQAKTFVFQPPDFNPTEYYQLQGSGLARNRKEPLEAITYFCLIRNIGTIDWYTGIPIAEKAQPKYFIDLSGNLGPNPNYRREAYLAEDPTLDLRTEIHPNSIQIRAPSIRPATIIVNQNYHRGWRTNAGELYNAKGLLGLRLEEVGVDRIRLAYRPISFYLGLSISLVTLVGVAILIFKIEIFTTRDFCQGCHGA